MHPSDVSAYNNLLPTSDLRPARRAEAAARTGHSTAPRPLDSSSLSASARALSEARRPAVEIELSADRLAALREARPDIDQIAAAILRVELDAGQGD